jgi:NADPH:quinone reductase-like Zn-dependent oxidoreductase
MKAIVQDKYGSPDVLELKDIDKPAVDDDDVLVRVSAASVNAADWHIVRGSPYVLRIAMGLRRPKNPVPGIDVAGEVEAVGTNVKQHRPGDQVFGWCDGAFAEYACAGEDHFAPKPANLTFEQAAAVPVAAFTALQGLRDQGRVQPGQKVLIIGASGGVGTFAVQLAKAFEADVTGVCSAGNVELVRSIGADHVIDYTREDFTRGRQRYDVIFQLAGTRSPSDLRRALAPRGTLVLSSGAGRFAGIDRIIKALALSPFVRQRLTTFVSKENKADLIVLKELIEAGKVTPVIDRRYLLSETPEAIRYLEKGHAQGKVVITVERNDKWSNASPLMSAKRRMTEPREAGGNPSENRP